MISLAIFRIAKGNIASPTKVDFTELPIFIGIGLYSFMCQHSLPSLLYPIRRTHKSYTKIFVISISAVLVLYLIITYTGVFAFEPGVMEQVYTTNFLGMEKGTIFVILGYFLQLFPVVALTSSYPVVGITLRENIKALVFKDASEDTQFKFFIKRIFVPAMVIYPPYFAMLFLSDHVGIIAGIVGSYAGNLVQYVIPSLLLYYGQQKAREVIGETTYKKNFQRSPFGHAVYICVILIWSFACIGIVTYYNYVRYFKHQ